MSPTLARVLALPAPGRHPAAALTLCAATALLLPVAAAQAGAGGTEFDPFYDTIVDWAQGSLGKALALAMFIVGIGMGVVRGSVVAAVPAVSGALGLFIAPTIIDAIMTATLTGAPGSLALPAVEAALRTPS